MKFARDRRRLSALAFRGQKTFGPLRSRLHDHLEPRASFSEDTGSDVIAQNALKVGKHAD